MESKEYYYLNGDAKVGPLTLEALKFAPISPATLVWNNSLPDWVEARSLPELAEMFMNATVSPPAPPSTATAYNAGTAYGNPDKPPMPETYLVLSIIVTIVCCWPIGIASIVNAAKVSSAYNSGDYEGAQKASENAKKWAIWTVVGGVVSWIIYFILIFSLGLSGLMDEMM